MTYISELSVGTTTERANRASLWQLYPDGWKLAFHQGTPLPDA
ncbi:hypothetical protein [Sagittula sp. S175]